MKNYTKLFGILFLWFLLTSLFLGIAVADDDDEDDDGVDDNHEEYNRRELEIEVSSDEIEINSELESGNIKSQLEIDIELEEDDGLEIQVSYEIESEDDDDEEEDDEEEDDVETSDEETDIEFEITLHSLTEFVDLDADGIFNPTTDTTIKEVLLNSFDKPKHTQSDIEGEEGKLHKIEITSTDGVFTIRFFITESFTEVSGDTLTPTEIKFDIEINNFNYDNDSSQLALMTILESEDDYDYEEETDDEEEGYSDDEEGAEIKSGGEQGFFTWKDTAEVDGVTTPVLASDLMVYEGDDDEQKLYLNYQRGTNILHDPKIGIAVDLITELPADYILLIIGIVSVVGIAGVVFAIKRVKGR